MKISVLDKVAFFNKLPNEWEHELFEKILYAIKQSGKKVVVLDDDPTGTQTVHNVPVLTQWSKAIFEKEFENNFPGFFVLTNSRSCSSELADKLNYEIGQDLVAAAKTTKSEFTIISRSDSTLRGHFPSELNALERGMQINYDVWMLLPAFIEGGRFTIENIHYVTDGEKLIPAGLTEFAKDNVFGYHSSNLADWVMEKFKDRINCDKISSISLIDIRQGGPEKVAEMIDNLTGGHVCIANLASIKDLEVLTLGALKAEAKGKKILYRSAASFSRTRMGISQRPLLCAEELSIPREGGSLVVVGSHVPKSTRQLEVLLSENNIEHVEVCVKSLLYDESKNHEIKRVSDIINNAFFKGGSVVISTSRNLIFGESILENLNISQNVSEALVRILNNITMRPRFIIAKGGITSSDIATKALKIKRALVKGQIIPGVPVWECDKYTKYPGLCYAIFPGNVGDAYALSNVFKTLNQKEFRKSSQ